MPLQAIANFMATALITLRQLSAQPKTIPTATTWYLADLGQALGKQQLFTHRAPQKLKALRERALIESAVSSNCIEGVEVEGARVGTIVFGESRLRDRDEEEVRGCRNALKWIHDSVQRGHDSPTPRLPRNGIGYAVSTRSRKATSLAESDDQRGCIWPENIREC
jgi:hypothetical protein